MDKKACYDVIVSIWKVMAGAIDVVPSVTNAQDRRWVDICDALERIEKEAPPELRYYAGSMVLLHMDTLERMWRIT